MDMQVIVPSAKTLY